MLETIQHLPLPSPAYDMRAYLAPGAKEVSKLTRISESVGLPT